MDDEELHYWANLWTEPTRDPADDTWFDYFIQLKVTGELVKRLVPAPAPRPFDVQKARKNLDDLRVTIDGMKN